MAGDWIKMRTNLDTDPAVVRIASGLKLDRYSIVGRLHKIWAWANEHLSDGQDVPVDAAFLDSLVGTDGFAAEMRNAGWLTGRDGSLCFPEFERHNGSSAKARAQDSARKKNVRKVSNKCPGDNRTETGLEKRRGEKSKKQQAAPAEKNHDAAADSVILSPFGDFDDNEFVMLWNAIPGVRRSTGASLNAPRRDKVRSNLEDATWDWRAAIERMTSKPIKPYTKGWKPSLDWFLDPGKVTLILEGQFDTKFGGDDKAAADLYSSPDNTKEIY